MFSSLPRRCATSRVESTIQEGSPKIAAPFGAFIFTGGEDNRVASSSPAATAVHYHPKVSESRSPRHHDAIGEDLVEFGEPEHW
jgi:hypothetical protein